ncbi:DegT/DnrJ/EryC1/StrS family aminotransferase [Candidatus Babeliales bacterium]|nr:DegT/DnrJ/EryC1/StrS family aminotransferase [Candidatus Babeliales bacterium]
MKIFENKYVNTDSCELDQIKEVLKSNQLSGMASIILKYESKLASYFKTKYALAVTNGTTAIEIALRAAGVKIGDEVITTPLGPVMTPLPILAVGATPVFVDCESSDSFNISVDDLKNKITSKTKVVISVPMWGYPNDMHEIKAFCKNNNIILIEDVSHCHGTMLSGNFQGTFGDIGIFSTQERKLIGTGEGGFILTNDNYLAARIQELRNFGKPIRKELIDMGFADQYGYLFGLNYRLNAFAAGIGIVQIDKLENKIQQRTNNAAYYKKNLNSHYLNELKIMESSRPNYYAIVYKVLHPEYSAFELGVRLSKFGIISDTYRFKYKVLFKMPLFKTFASSCPNAETLSESIITLPTHEGLSHEDLRFIVDKVNDILV